MGINQGMTQSQVESVLGKPDFRRFDGDMEEWEFHRDNGTPVPVSYTHLNIDANGYKVSTSVSATPQVVKANYSINIKGTEAVKGEAYLNGSNMTADEGANENGGDRFKDARIEANSMGEAAVDVYKRQL